MDDPKEAAFAANDTPETDVLEQVQKESEHQGLPEQEKVFRVARRIRSRLTNLPDPTHAPLGFVPGRGYDVVFPFIGLPELRPTLNGDWVQFGSPELEPNLLYYGDNLQVLRTLPTESIDLIYIDPPFFSGEDYNVIWGDANEVRTFNDIWDGGLDTYLIWLNARLWEMRRVLKSTGSIFVHCDWHASHYIKGEMDKIFGYDFFRNEIVWAYRKFGRSGNYFPRSHDAVLFYAKGESNLFMPQYIPPSESTLKRWGTKKRGGKDPWNRYATEEKSPGAIMPDHWPINLIIGANPERIGYPTQKP